MSRGYPNASEINAKKVISVGGGGGGGGERGWQSSSV